MFVAFPLYVVHAVLTGLSPAIAHPLDIHLGFSFSAGLIDLLLYGTAPAANLSDPAAAGAVDTLTHTDSTAEELIEAFGGRENLVHVEACITRLRVDVADKAEVHQDRLRALGAAGRDRGRQQCAGGVRYRFRDTQEQHPGDPVAPQTDNSRSKKSR